MNRKDYPLSSFPQSLTWLQVQTCSLRKIDNRILQLRNLQVLDLAHNCIKELPTALGSLKLKELVLTHNEIAHFPVELSTGTLGQTLRVLDLSYNQVRIFKIFFLLSSLFCYVIDFLNNHEFLWKYKFYFKILCCIF